MSNRLVKRWRPPSKGAECCALASGGDGGGNDDDDGGLFPTDRQSAALPINVQCGRKGNDKDPLSNRLLTSQFESSRSPSFLAASGVLSLHEIGLCRPVSVIEKE